MRLVLSLASSAVTPYFAIRNYLEFALPEADISCVVFNDSEGNVRLPRRLVSHLQEERTWWGGGQCPCQPMSAFCQVLDFMIHMRTLKTLGIWQWSRRSERCQYSSRENRNRHCHQLNTHRHTHTHTHGHEICREAAEKRGRGEKDLERGGYNVKQTVLRQKGSRYLVWQDQVCSIRGGQGWNTRWDLIEGRKWITFEAFKTLTSF